MLQKGKQREAASGDPRVSMWEPPQSPYSLIEEELFGNPWRLLVACILLNKTSIVQVSVLQTRPSPQGGSQVNSAVLIHNITQACGMKPA